jgi:RNA polymerase sigma-70 factor (ECF subfamily)
MQLLWRRPAATEPDASAVADADDGTLVRSAQRTPGAFEPLYLRYRDRIFAYCYYRLGNRAEAEDAASAVFVKALGHLPGFRDRHDSFRTWLFRIAHNEVADRHKRRGRRPEAPLTAAHAVADPGRSPEDLAVLADGRRRVLVLLAALPARERAVLELRAAELETGEIARVLGISEQNVRTTQARAVARLRRRLEGVGPDADGRVADA